MGKAKKPARPGEKRKTTGLWDSQNYCEYYCTDNRWTRIKDNSASGYFCPTYIGVRGCSASAYTTVPGFPRAEVIARPKVPKNKAEYTMVGKTLYLNRSNVDARHYCPPILQLHEIAGIDKPVSRLLTLAARARFLSSITIFVRAIRLRKPASRPASRKQKRPSSRRTTPKKKRK